jgi:hypothetical protein
MSASIVGWLSLRPTVSWLRIQANLKPQLLLKLRRSQCAGPAGATDAKSASVADNGGASATDACEFTRAEGRPYEGCLCSRVPGPLRMECCTIGGDAASKRGPGHGCRELLQLLPLPSPPASVATILIVAEVGMTPVRVVVVMSRLTPRFTH